MLKIFKYTFYDLVRSRWMYIYTAFYLLTTFAFLWLSPELAKVVISLTNITIVLAPLIGILFGIIYYYGSTDYIHFLLAQPIRRSSIFLGVFLGLSASLCLSVLIGLGLPMVLYGILGSTELPIFLVLLTMSLALSVIFGSLAFVVAIKFDDRVKGFAVGIFTWLFFAIVYDGLFLFLLLTFKDYPLDYLTIGLTVFNPIDLARILVLLKLDVSAMMGFTGAVLQNTLGQARGAIMIVMVLAVWIVLPTWAMLRLARRKDF